MSSINMDMKAFINKVLPKDQANKMKVRTMRRMQNVNAKLAKTSVGKVERTFRCCSATSLFKKQLLRMTKSLRDTS